MLDAFRRLFGGEEKAPAKSPPSIEKCPDCGTPSGKLHDLFCTKERCPFCGGQLITCDCAGTVLNLTAAEQKILDEYVDDSVPPLSGIMQRWRNALDKKGRLPFESYADDPIRAAFRGDIDTLELFLANGSDPNAGNEVGYTPLMAAARGEKLAAIQFLLSRGATVNRADARGFTALHWVVGQPTNRPLLQLECLRALVNAGADPNAKGKEGGTPLMTAAWFGSHDSLRELLLRGSNPTFRDDKGKTALDLATQRGHAEIVKLLTAHTSPENE